jgi:hypothetical protein
MLCVPCTRSACSRGPLAPRSAWHALLPLQAARSRWPSCSCASRGRALTQEPSGMTLRNHARRKASPQRVRSRPCSFVHGGGRCDWPGRRSRLPSGAQRLAEPPCGGEGARGIHGTGRAQRRRCFPLCPWGGGLVRQGAAAVRARCRADGGQERGLAAQRFAGAVQRRRPVHGRLRFDARP